MINTINTNSRYITIAGQKTPIPHISPGSVGSGMIRWNANTNQMEVNDGNVWLPLSSSHTSIDLSVEAENLLDWARKKQKEEQELESLAKTNPAVRLAMDDVVRAQEKLKLIRDLSIEHEPN